MSSDSNSGIEGPFEQALEIARAECRQLRHAELDVGHLFLGLLQAFPDQSTRLLRGFGLKRPDMIDAVRSALPAGGGGDGPAAEPTHSNALADVLREVVEISGADEARFEHGMVGILRHEGGLPRNILESFGVDAKTMETVVLTSLAAIKASKARPPAKVAKQQQAEKNSLVAQLTRNMIETAKAGKYDPVIGRDRQIDDVLETLSRRQKNNPVLVGEPGVGKSAIVEGLAQRIADGDVPKRLKTLRLQELSPADLVAGTQYRGDFEARILKLVEETSQDPDIVLFIDEIHTILAAGGQQGTGDAAALLKPHLARGTLRCLGATTTDEFRKFLEKDRALVRRFQPINVPEPTVDECIDIVKGVSSRFEEHHEVKLEEAALEAAVRLTKKHIPERALPDKAFDLIDQACARKVLRNKDVNPSELTVTAEDVAALLRDQLGKNLGEITIDESERLLGIEEFLRQRVVGQDHVAHRTAERIRLAKRELDFRPERPNGVFLFLGPTGVGKTEVARCLAEYLLGSRQRLLRYDLSEFSEPHSISKIIGSPPGYVGYDDEGHQLTSKIRSNPQSILLLDEIEKAHPSVLNLFLQVFEDGRLTDAQGRTVSFSEIVIILTSNIGAETFKTKESIGFGKDQELPQEEIRAQAKEKLKNRLPPELINRMDEVLVFNALTKDDILAIAERLVDRAVDRFRRESKAIDIDKSAIEFLGESGYDPQYGARHLQRNVEQLLLQPLARETYLSDWNRVEKIQVTKRGSALVFEKVYKQSQVSEASAPGLTQ